LILTGKNENLFRQDIAEAELRLAIHSLPPQAHPSPTIDARGTQQVFLLGLSKLSCLFHS